MKHCNSVIVPRGPGATHLIWCYDNFGDPQESLRWDWSIEPNGQNYRITFKEEADVTWFALNMETAG